MVDFRRRLGKPRRVRFTDPVAIYDTLDRASDKGELRKAQEAVLKQWYENAIDQKDVILKMHTGQGKTLVGLLMLQSKLNACKGPALYLCANKFLVNQTCAQAKQFGIAICTAEPDLPTDFLEGKSILVTSVHKLFNGLTKFGLGNRAHEVGAIVIDDAHACVDTIRQAFVMRLEKGDPAYASIRDLFADELENQGVGTFADIRNGDYGSFLPVPYWAWQDRVREVTNALSRRTDSKAVKFSWPLLKDILTKCQCVVSGAALEISPYLPPLRLFKSYSEASSRVFMSATVADDSFLIKGLGLSPDVVSNPLAYDKQKWSGEKMMLIPSLIDESLDRGTMVKFFAERRAANFGIVALTPSFKRSRDWDSYGAVVATNETIDAEIEKIQTDKRDKPLVMVNRYDGIDLLDDACRILIFDSEPYSESLIDLYVESCRRKSETTLIRKVRAIEQGFGRSVRGERDYCIVVIIGPDLVKFVRSQKTRGHLSNQTQLQIQIGFDIADMADEELQDGASADSVLKAVMKQCLLRDEAWKEFYSEQMEAVEPEKPSKAGLDLFSRELKAEQLHERGNAESAIEVIQSLIDDCVQEDEELGWYLQEMARYALCLDSTRSTALQRHAHLKNHDLLKPRSGMQVQPIVVVSDKRIEASLEWIMRQQSYEELHLALEEILRRLTFGIKADRFEEAFNELGRFLGFVGQRPEKEWKEGPDNLWGLREGVFLLAECKSEVDLKRAEINEREVEQMNRSCAWFDANYTAATCHNWLIIPPRRLKSTTSFTHDVSILRKSGLGKLVSNVRKVVEELGGSDIRDLSERRLQQLFDAHSLSIEDICEKYTKPPK